MITDSFDNKSPAIINPVNTIKVNALPIFTWINSMYRVYLKID